MIDLSEWMCCVFVWTWGHFLSHSIFNDVYTIIFYRVLWPVQRILSEEYSVDFSWYIISCAICRVYSLAFWLAIGYIFQNVVVVLLKTANKKQRLVEASLLLAGWIGVHSRYTKNGRLPDHSNISQFYLLTVLLSLLTRSVHQVTTALTDVLASLFITGLEEECTCKKLFHQGQF